MAFFKDIHSSFYIRRMSNFGLRLNAYAFKCFEDFGLICSLKKCS